jgi:hypothetical protein
MKRSQHRHRDARHLKKARADNGFHKQATKILRQLKDRHSVPQEMLDRLRELADFSN